MQRALFQNPPLEQLPPRTNRMLPGHGTGIGEQAVNDETFHREPSKLQILITVLGNVIGGALLLGGMFVLPQLVAGLLA